MRAVIVLNGERSEYVFDKDDFVIACDGALEYLTERGVVPDAVLGDFDSLGYIPENSISVPAEKDYTDGELALDYAKKQGYDELVFICGGGLREDHFLGNLALLQMASKSGIESRMETKYSTIFFVDSPVEKDVAVGTTLSLIAVDPTFVKSSSGLKYAFKDTLLKTDTTLGISNIAVEDKVFLDISYGGAYLIINKQKI